MNTKTFSIKISSGAFVFALLLIFFNSCKKGELLPNLPPDTKLFLDEINRVGENRLNTTFRLSWFGTDEDGFVEKFEYKINEGQWISTRIQDSTFQFDLLAGSDTTDISFYIRAIDNEGLTDPSPAFLRIPIKNAKPIVAFDQLSLPQDTAHIVYTFRYSFADPEGVETVTNAYLKANDGEWVEINRNEKLISIVTDNPKNLQRTTASIYYGGNRQAEQVKLNGIKNNGENIFQLKVKDNAGADSKTDSANVIFLKPQKSDVLLVSGQSPTIATKYAGLVKDAYSQADVLDYANSKRQPKFWQPTFRLIANNYDKIFLFGDQATYNNSVSGVTNTLLGFAAPTLQLLLDGGKKVLLSVTFDKAVDITDYASLIGVDSFSAARGQAILPTDSAIIAQKEQLSNLQANNFLLGVDPFYPSFNTEKWYTAQLLPSQGWSGPRTVAVSKKNAKQQTNLIFFSVELHGFDKDPSKLSQTFSYIFNENFNW